MDQQILRTETGYQLGDLCAIGLTPRESQALLFRATEHSVEQCAKLMGCSKASVQDRISTLFLKFHVRSTEGLITKAFKTGALKFLTLILCTLLSINTQDSARISRIKISRVHTRYEQRIC